MNAFSRLLLWTLAGALVAAPVVAVVNGWAGTQRFPLRTLRVEGQLQRVDEAALRAAVAPYASKGFFAVDLDAVRRAVSALPWVERAEVRKQWPDIVSIQVREHVPFARWGNDHLLSQHGAIFPMARIHVPAGMPLLEGPDSQANEVAALYVQANQLLQTTGQRVTALGMDARGSWSLQLADGTQLELGRQDPMPRLQRFAPMLARLAAQRPQARIVSADLRYTNGFALTWAARMPAPQLPAAAPAVVEGKA